MIHYEYQVIRQQISDASMDGRFARMLNDAAKDGWEVVNICMRHVPMQGIMGAFDEHIAYMRKATQT